uniref:LCCL domain-containing protein n=1 Tax=Strongyloides venezuelensis TaxID=75913 RepID=A0A0K0F3L4_STRVS
MLLKLYCLGAALALMPLPTQPLGPQQETLFPYISRDITNTTFPFDLNVTTNSDVVLVKCPNFRYSHISNDSFTPNFEVFISGSTYSPSDNSFAWVPLLKSKTGSTYLKCGRINLEDVGNPYYDWIFNVIWQNVTSNQGFFKRGRNIGDISPQHSKCNSDGSRLKIFGIKREGGFTFIDNPQSLLFSFANQTFYYFKKPSEDEKTKEPCGILQIYSDNPKIKLPKHESTSDIQEPNKTRVIKLTISDPQIIDVVLDMGGNINYYRGEKIILEKMKYVKGELQVIENSKTIITSNFSINGYEIVKLTYYAPYDDRDVEITERYYFAPSSSDHIINEKAVEYFKNDTSSNPNCPLFYLNIGYLYKFKHNVTEKDYSDSVLVDTINEISSKTESHIFFKGIGDPHLIIRCLYKTPDGSITTITEFVDMDKIAANNEKIRLENLENEKNKNKTEQLKYDEFKRKIENQEMGVKKSQKETEEIKKKLLETNKSLFKKLSDKVGERNAYILAAGFILLILIILTVLMVILYKKWLSPFIIMLKQKRKYPNVYVFWKNLTSQPFDSYCQAIKEKKYLSNKVLNQIVVKKMEGGEEVDAGVSHLFDKTLVKCYRRFPRKIKAHYIYTDIEKRKYILSDVSL